MNIIQETLFPPPERPEILYLRLIRPGPQRHIAPEVDPNGSAVLELNRKEILSTDTFFGSFYTAYWQRFTVIRNLQVALSMTGAGQLRIFEETEFGVTRLISVNTSSDGKTPVIISITPIGMNGALADAAAPSGRIFIEFEATEPTRLRAIDFVSDQKPVQNISLSIGLCTFNQEAFLTQTLQRLKTLADREGALRRIYVINQGKPFRSPEIQAILNSSKFRLVQQRNLGGSGGFTRSIVEAQNAPTPASHHLLMDDDIILDERLIERSLRFLSFTDRPIALGAAMLDALRPSVVHEAGAFLRRDNTIVPFCHDVDMADSEQLHHFNRVVMTDYNAWWYCILPLAPTRDIGLPVPVFIRGDDFEYGQRLARKDIPTITLPGIGIWHEPFYAKPPGWQGYYDLRNRLIFGATYPEKVAPLSALRLTRLLVEPVLAHQYMTAALRLKAVSHFLEGPRALFAKDPEMLHSEVMALARSLAPETLEDNLWKTHPAEGAGNVALGRMRDILKTYITTVFSLVFLPYKKPVPVFMVADAHPGNTRNRPYVMTNAPRSFHLKFTPRRKTTIVFLFRAVKTVLQYQMSRRPVSQNWFGSIPKYRTSEYWQDVFGPDPTSKAVQP